MQIYWAISRLVPDQICSIPAPAALQQHIIATFRLLATRADLVPRCNAILDALNYMDLSASNWREIIDLLAQLIHQSLNSPSWDDPRTLLIFGTGLKIYSQQGEFEPTKAQLWPQIYQVADRLGTLPSYLEAILHSLTLGPGSGRNGEVNSLVEVLVKNLHSPSHTLRKLSLEIISAIHTRSHSNHIDILNTALAIENSSIDLQSARSLSLHVRRLSTEIETITSSDWLQKAVTHYGFGLLTFKLSPLWSDAVDLLKDISRSKAGEELITRLAFQFLEEIQNASAPFGVTVDGPTKGRILSNFECSNLIAVESRMRENLVSMKDSLELIESRFHAIHHSEIQNPLDASTVALRILLGMPHIAEKHSRQLVPIFLRTVSEDKEDNQFVSAKSEGATYETEEVMNLRGLAGKERKMLLDLFGCFTNPKVLYRSKDVFEALRSLLASGDDIVQKSALKALLTWRTPGIEPYQENLTNLLDDARFRDELTVFVNLDNQHPTIQDEHRQDLMPILLRLLFGKAIARPGSGSRTGQAIKRKAILGALSHFAPEDVGEFIAIALGPLAGMRLLNEAQLNEELLKQEMLSVRRQTGLVNMVKSMLDTLGSRIAPLARDLINALLYCSIRAARLLSSASEDIATEAPENNVFSLLKDLRQIGLQCLTILFKHVAAEVMQPYLPTLFSELINPRLKKLPLETAQSVSGLLRLFATWASSRDMVFFLNDYNSAVLPSVVDCLSVPSAKPVVKLFVLDHIIKEIATLAGAPIDLNDQHSPYGVEVVQRVLSPHVEYILRHVGRLIQENPNKDLLESSIQLVSMLAHVVQGSTETRDILEISAFLLEQPSHRVRPKPKGDLLRIIQHFVPISDLRSVRGLHDRLFCTISSLFGYFKDRINRQSLCVALHTLADADSELRDVAELCTSLNSFSTQKLDEPNFEQRLAAFNTINETKFQSFTPKQWRPFVHNMLFYIRDHDELAIRSNAALALRRFVECNTFETANSRDSAFALLESVLLPALRKGASEQSELVRLEYLNVMAHVVRRNPNWEKTNDLCVLLVNDDEEASFFGNILHIQYHRRLRALRRLAGEARKGVFHSDNVAHFLIPLVEQFVFDKAEDESAHSLSAETVATIPALALSLEWPQFRALLQRYTGYIQSKPGSEKTVIKLVSRTMDALSEAITTRETQCASIQQNTLNSREPLNVFPHVTLARTVPRQEKLTDDITRNFLPSLREYVHQKDESTVSLRVPMAVTIVKLLKLLPPDILREHLPPILTDLCNILRSRAQESRDLTRKTLVDISTLIGPSSFGFVLKELRNSLSRGYQLHVLSYTMHAILTATAEIFQPGELDYCIPQIVSIIIDDTFGATGQEKDAEEYISKMKEVKSSKSSDSMELVSKVTSIDSFIHLLRPLQNLLLERLDSKMIKKLDELLRRIGAGFLRNKAINDRRILVFCYELMRTAYESGSASRTPSNQEDYRTKRFLIDMKATDNKGIRGSNSSYGYKLARFSLNVLRSVLHKYDALQTPANIAGFIPIIGDSVVQPNEEVQISALRLLYTIIKVPLADIDENAGIYVAESVKIIKAATDINSELAQAALKLISAILRERRHIEVRESDLAYLLKRLVPDLEEPNRQGVVFGFLRALLARKVLLTEVYDVMDTVATIMITNHTKGARDLARSVYFQFIVDYPQGKGRFAKQLTFLAHNLDYKHQEGRQSVMEAMHLLLSKVSQDLAQEIADTFFVPLVLVIVNDESAHCRQMAGELVKIIIAKMDPERHRSFIAMLRSWLDQNEQSLLVRAALQISGFYLESSGQKFEKEVPHLLGSLGHLLKTTLRDSSADWELLYMSLQTFSKVCQSSPAHAFAASSAPLWALVRQCLNIHNAWVKLTAAKLLGLYFADFARSNAVNEEKKLPLKGSGGLLLNSEEMLETTKASLRSLNVPGISEELAAQSVRNLVFLSRTLGQLVVAPSHQQSADLDEEEEEEEEIDGQGAEEQLYEKPSRTAMQVIIERASAIVRGGLATNTHSILTSMKAALQLIAALCNHFSAHALLPSIPTILLPLHNLTDPSVPKPQSADKAFNTAYQALVSNSVEIMSLLQKKLGTTEYVSILNKVRTHVKERREGRRVKRRIEAVAQPEKAGKLKQRKGEKKREKRKERGGEERGRRRGW